MAFGTRKELPTHISQTALADEGRFATASVIENAIVNVVGRRGRALDYKASSMADTARAPEPSPRPGWPSDDLQQPPQISHRELKKEHLQQPPPVPALSDEEAPQQQEDVGRKEEPLHSALQLPW